MDSSLIANLANLTTTIIVAVTAFAALRQMRHNYMANELQLHLHFIDEVNDPEMSAAINWMREFAARMNDAAYRESFLRDPHGEDGQRFTAVARFFERYASLVVVSGLSEHLILHEYAGMIELLWDNMHETIWQRRITRRSPYVGRAFEHLAMRAKRYLATQQARDYDRLERDPRLVALEQAAAVEHESAS